MPQPTHSDAHVNALLTNISIAYIQSEANFIASRVFPVISVQKQSDRYMTYDRSYWFRSEAQKRAPSTESAGSGFTIDNTPTYFADVYAVHKDIDDHIRANQDAPFNVDRDSTQWVTHQMLLKKEKLWVAKYFLASPWTTQWTGVGSNPTTNQVLQWNQTSSTPIKDIENAKIVMAELTGFLPNTLVVGPRVFAALAQCGDVLDRVKYTQRGVISQDLMASMFGVSNFLVPYVTENTANEGQTAAYSLLYGKNALLCYAAPAPSLMHPSAGYTFSWTGLLGAGAYGSRIKTFRMEPIQSDRVEAEMAFDMKVVAGDLGLFITDVIG